MPTRERRLTTIQQVVLGEIIWHDAQPERRDARTVRSLERRGLIERKADPPGLLLCPPTYQATAAGRALMVAKDPDAR